MLQQVVVVSVVLHTCLGVDLTYYIEEGKSPGTYLGDIYADMHVMDSVASEDRELITFSQMQQSTPEIAQLFRIAKKTGKLYTAQTLDAESICTRNIECFKMLEVAIRRGKSFMKVFEVKIVINDINDHQPEFPSQKFDIEFSEESIKGARRGIPNAFDKDVGVKNSQISYYLKKNDDEPFTLYVSKNVDGTSKLSITLEERLNREVKDSYLVQVIAKDGGTPAEQSVLNVQISVTDVNDNPPVFSQNAYNVSIKNEHDQVTPIAILSATDLDLGKNGKITYHYSSQTVDVAKEHFQLNSETGEIFLHKKFNVGQKLTYKLYIEATDGGSPPLNSIAMVLVNVISQKNNAPTIDVNFVSASTGNTATISEDIKVGSFIAYVKVTDHDFGPNGEVICNLHHDKFQLQSLGTKKYKIIIKKAVDREMNDHHDIVITCQDRGYPPLRSETRFSIQVMDVNDEKPHFPKDTVKFWTYENQKPKSIIGSINATDPDSGAGGRLTYSLLSNNQNFLPFFITNNGLISTILPLDYEFQTTYKFQVVVKDHGIPPLNNTVNVVVEVKDVNDNAPYFTFPSVNPYSMDVVYYPRHTNNVTVLKASDIDSRENAFLKYEIVSGNSKQLFSLDHYSGLLSFTRVVIMDDAGSYELQLVVKDSGTPVLSATTNLFLMLTVSNKTSGMLTNSYKQGEDKIHMFLLIIIVLVSMAISIPVTAAISICFVRCKQRKTPQHRGGVNPSYKHEQRHLMCSTHQDTNWSNAPTNRNTDAEQVRDVPLTKASRGIYPGDKLDDVKKGTGPDIVYHDLEEEEAEQREFMTSGFHASVMPSSHNDSEDSWSDGDTGKLRQHSEMCPSRSNHPVKQNQQPAKQNQNLQKQNQHPVKQNPKTTLNQKQNPNLKQTQNPKQTQNLKQTQNPNPKQNPKQIPIQNQKQIPIQNQKQIPIQKQNAHQNQTQQKLQPKQKVLVRTNCNQKFTCPEVTRVTSRCLKTPNLGHIPDCTQWMDMRPPKMDNTPAMSRNQYPNKCSYQLKKTESIPETLQLPVAKKKC